MPFRVFSGGVIGLDAFPIEVEVDATPGLHFFNIVGLPDKTVQESTDRIASAIKNSGFVAPNQKNNRVIVNLAPADIRKEGPAYDLPIALGYLLATKQLEFETDGRIFLGELSLDGSLRRVNGVLPVAMMAKARNFKEIILPEGNVGEASIIEKLRIIGVKTLAQLIQYLQGKIDIRPAVSLDYDKLKQDVTGGGNDDVFGNNDDACANDGDISRVRVTRVTLNDDSDIVDLGDIKGNENAKRALLIAASGGHNLLLYGPPGSGKTLLSRALATILPDMTRNEAIEVTKIYSISGLIGNGPIIIRRPFRNPHHTTSTAAVIGGGSWPKPGEISLAHRGVLFLDELPEFPRGVTEALRQPMESGEVVVSRASGSVRFPSRFILVSAMNPCPCGNYGDQYKLCVCSAVAISKYQHKISGPLLDRIDIQVNVPRENYDKLSGPAIGPTSLEMRLIVAKTREVQFKRFADSGTRTQTNSEMSPKEIKKYCHLDQKAEEILKSAIVSHNLSGRGYHKILKIARTIADLNNKEIIQINHIAEAIAYRIKPETDALANI